MKPRANYEERFYLALQRIKAYMSPERLRRHSERQYGLGYEEALEMAYENVIGEAEVALRGYRRPKPAPPSRQEDSSGEVKEIAQTQDKEP